jgi:hypothetical protein
MESTAGAVDAPTHSALARPHRLSSSDRVPSDGDDSDDARPKQPKPAKGILSRLVPGAGMTIGLGTMYASTVAGGRVPENSFFCLLWQTGYGSGDAGRRPRIGRPRQVQ